VMPRQPKPVVYRPPAPIVSRQPAARVRSVPPTPAEKKTMRRPLSSSSSAGGTRNLQPAGTPRTVAVPGVDSKLVELIENEIVDRSPAVKWDDIGKGHA
jgi:hypothetical protein